MKIFKIFVLLFSLLIVSCGEEAKDSDSSSLSSSYGSSDINSGSSNGNSSSSDSSSSGTDVTPIDIVSIADAITLANQLVGATVNGKKIQVSGYYIGNYAEGNSHVAALTDGVDIIYVRYSATLNYVVGKTYIAIGNISKYYSHIEIQCTEALKATQDIAIDMNELSKDYSSINELYQQIKLLSLSNKGTCFTEVVTFTAQYIFKPDNSQLLVYDGTNIISVHGDSKINNGFTLNRYYQFTGILGSYIYKPSIEFISATPVVDDTVQPLNSNMTITNSDFYRLKAENENSQYFPYLITYTGYVQLFQSGSTEYYVLVDSHSQRFKWQSGDTNNANGLYIRNDWQIGSPMDAIMYDHYENKTQVTVTLSLYQYITNYHAWFFHVQEFVA